MKTCFIRPFYYKFFSYDNSIREVTFRCSCGSNLCVKLKLFSDDSDDFFSGYFMCYKCGKSVIDGKPLNYYHPCFIVKPLSEQLTFEF